MTTLIFRTEKDFKGQFGRGMKTVFVKEGSISDAISYFDGSRDFGSIFHNDEKGYFFSTDDDGRPMLTDEEANNAEGSFCVDQFTCFSKNIDNLDEEELLIAKDAAPYLF